jgi:ABC-type glycerol-3-phosphate transport system substrate-binding protein
MKTSHSLTLLPAVVVSLTLGACGGGSSTTAAAPPSVPADTAISQAAVVQYMNSSIAATSETTTPVDVNTATLAADETSEPEPI